MCHLNQITGTQCAAICSDGWDPLDCSKKVYKADCLRCTADLTRPYCYGDGCSAKPVEPAPASLVKSEEEEVAIGLIIGAAVGGFVLTTGGIFAGIKLAKVYSLKKTRVVNISRPQQYATQNNVSQLDVSQTNRSLANSTQGSIFQGNSSRMI